MTSILGMSRRRGVIWPVQVGGFDSRMESGDGQCPCGHIENKLGVHSRVEVAVTRPGSASWSR